MLPADRPDVQSPERPLEQELATLRTIGEAACGPEARHNTTAYQGAPETIPDVFLAADRILVRCNGHMPPLLPLYDGPYGVLLRAPRFFTICMGDREETVHVHSLYQIHRRRQATSSPSKTGPPANATSTASCGHTTKGCKLQLWAAPCAADADTLHVVHTTTA